MWQSFLLSIIIILDKIGAVKIPLLPPPQTSQQYIIRDLSQLHFVVIYQRSRCYACDCMLSKLFVTHVIPSHAKCYWYYKHAEILSSYCSCADFFSLKVAFYLFLFASIKSLMKSTSTLVSFTWIALYNETLIPPTDLLVVKIGLKADLDA